LDCWALDVGCWALKRIEVIGKVRHRHGAQKRLRDSGLLPPRCWGLVGTPPSSKERKTRFHGNRLIDDNYRPGRRGKGYLQGSAAGWLLSVGYLTGYLTVPGDYLTKRLNTHASFGRRPCPPPAASPTFVANCQPNGVPITNALRCTRFQPVHQAEAWQPPRLSGRGRDPRSTRRRPHSWRQTPSCPAGTPSSSRHARA